jgi:hypothetical protein
MLQNGRKKSEDSTPGDEREPQQPVFVGHERASDSKFGWEQQQAVTRDLRPPLTEASSSGLLQTSNADCGTGELRMVFEINDLSKYILQGG